jgi:hypothetical protein
VIVVEAPPARWDSAWFRRLYAEIARLPGLPTVEQRAIRRALAADPIAFAIIYLGHHLRFRRGDEMRPISFSEIHFDWARIALSWAEPVVRPQQNRHVLVAPRESGKSTWFYGILPTWAAAMGHVRFVAAFSNDAGRAQGHLESFKHELMTNVLLRADFPELCEPARKQSGSTVADRQGMIYQRNGFVFAAKGIDASNLGMKVNERRPDLLILDDVEKSESNYSPEQAKKRLSTITDAIMPLNIYAKGVCIVGTTTMPGSVVHQAVKAAQGIEVSDWIRDERFECHWYNPVQISDDGAERSIWPEQWPLDWINEQRHTRSWALNYLNDPLGRDGDYWCADDFIYGDLPGVTRVGLFVDPAVTAKKTSDYTGIAVVGWAPSGRCVVIHAEQVKLVGARLREHIVRLIARFEEDDAYPPIKVVRVEANQAGDLWPEVFHHLPVPVRTHWSTVSKEIRFADALDHYQRRRVLHSKQFRVLEEQAVSFPKAPHDDVLDGVVAGIGFFLGHPQTKTRAWARTVPG